jgi:hypothetical protein
MGMLAVIKTVKNKMIEEPRLPQPRIHSREPPTPNVADGASGRPDAAPWLPTYSERPNPRTFEDRLAALEKDMAELKLTMQLIARHFAKKQRPYDGG